MAEDWKKILSKAYNRSLPEDTKQDEKNYIRPKDKGNPNAQKKHGDKEMPNRYLPLYKDFKKPDYTKPRPMEGSAHTGLLFDKFCDHWSGPDRTKPWKPETLKGDSVKKLFLDAIVGQMTIRNDTLMTDYINRREILIKTLKGESRDFTTSWRFVSGLGMGHVLETGFVWHRTLGVPYLPGSSVKGLIRAWADPKMKDNVPQGWGDPVKWDEKYKRLFGDEKDMGAGSLIVFDAIPEAKPKLEVDIMNPHYGDYYNKKPMTIKLANGKEQQIETPPADYLSPNPIFFLTVAPDVSFKFALAPRPGIGNTTDLNNGYNLLKEALENIGAGAKTAVGYGYFK